MLNIVHITDDMLNSKVYNGNSRKYGVTVGGSDWILKFAKKDENDTSLYSEYIASNFISALGVPCQQVVFAEYKGIPAVLMKDFVPQGYRLQSFSSIRQSSEDTDTTTKEYTYSDVLHMLNKHLKMSYNDKVLAVKLFWDMFICDAILGNRDRHGNNWGFIVGADYYRFAPLFDNGASLFPQVLSQLDKMGVTWEEQYTFMRDRVFIYPASLFKLRREDGVKRTNYYQMFSDLERSSIFKAEVMKFRERGVGTIYSCLQPIVSQISDVRLQSFYLCIVLLRYLCIVCRVGYDNAFQTCRELGCTIDQLTAKAVLDATKRTSYFGNM